MQPAVLTVAFALVALASGGQLCSDAKGEICDGGEYLNLIQRSSVSARKGSSIASPKQGYVIMIDCGSSKTKLHIFQTGPAENVSEVELNSSIKMDALASYLDRLQELEQDLEVMINKSKPYVPPADQAKTPIYMYATAGMRALEPEDQDAIFSACRQVLKSPDKSPYEFETDYARTMSGEMEAAFTYLSVNYDRCNGDVTCGGKETTGQLEMGGASLQVGFKPVPPSTVLDDSWVYNIHSQRITLYAKSYMGYGQNDARLSTLEMAASHVEGCEVPYPCYLSGYNESETVFQGTDNERQVTFYGTGNYAECKELTLSALHLDSPCGLPPCSIQGEYMVSPAGVNFVGVSGFRFATTNLGLPETGSTPAMLDAATKEFCGLAPDELDAYETPAEFLMNQCFLGNYAYNLLTKAFGFAENDTRIDYNGDYDWTLGATLYDVVFAGCRGSPAMLQLPGVAPIPAIDHHCYFPCTASNRCAAVKAAQRQSCKKACHAKCRLE